MKIKTKTLNLELLRKIDTWWRAAHYLSVGQIHLHDNPRLKNPLELAYIKPRLLGHMKNISLRFAFILTVVH